MKSTTITLHSNNAKAIFEAADLIQRSGYEVVHTSRYYYGGLVTITLGDKISDANLANFKHHCAVVLAGPILY